MPLPSLHLLPNNPTTGQHPAAHAAARSAVGGASSASAAGRVSRETLKELQDVVWSDDEDDPDCLLCAEPLDLSDLNFKPCQCGMQICQFCYNKLLTSDSRCPGCRRPYDAKAVVFQPVDWEEVKRAKEKKTRRAKTIKQLTTMGRRHLLGVRVVMKNMAYVVGMKLPAPGDEAIPILRSNDYFGQYGKIARLYLRDRTATSSSSVPTLDGDENSSTSTGIYIVYVRREDAARAISALDGIPAPSGPPGQYLKASHGTTRYCDSFLRGIKCDNQGCQNLHEWGGESDCFSKDDYETALLRPNEYDARQKQAQQAAVTAALSQKSQWPKPSTLEDAIGPSTLPTSAAWGKGVNANTASRTANPRGTAVPIGTSRPMKPISLSVPPLANNAAFPLPTPSPVIPPPIKEKKDKKEKAAEKAAAAAMAMARGKSNDSSQSAATGSAHPSPKKKPISLSTATITKNVPVPLPVSKPPGIPLPVPTPPTQLPSRPTEQIPLEEPQEGSVSAESEAGPSSSSPAPQTPTRQEEIESLPPPLTAEPIYFHSPYEEPLLFPFPSSDPEFAYVLGLEVDTSKRSGSTYQPSPFSRTLVGLAELGVLAPELPLPDLTSPAEGSPSEGHRFKSSFQPFEPMRDVVEEDMESSSVDEEEADVPRTTSRFDFARPSSRSTVARGQSPFAITRRGTVSDERDPWGRSTLNPSFTGLSFTPNREASSSNLGGGMGSGMGMRISSGDGDARQAMGFAGSTSGAGGAGAGYAGQSNDGWGQQSQSQTQGQTHQGSDSPYPQNSQTQRRTESHGYKESNRDDFESGPLSYGPTPSMHPTSRLFSPEPHDDSPHRPHHTFQSPSHAFQYHQQQHHSPMAYHDARSLQQYHRAQSPTPIGGFRRY